MPKHFSNAASGKHFKSDGTTPDEADLREGPQPNPPAEQKPEEQADDAQDPTNAMPAVHVPAPAAKDQATVLAAAPPVPPSTQPAQAPVGELYPETHPLPAAEASQGPTQRAQAPLPDVPTQTLRKREVARVSIDHGALRNDAKAGAYLTKRQANRNPEVSRRRHRAFFVGFFLILFAALVAGGAYAVYEVTKPAQNENPQQDLDTATIQKGEFLETIPASVTLEPVNSANVVPEVTGTVASSSVAEGTHVAQGDTLLVISNPEIDKAESDAKTKLDEAKGDIEAKTKAVEDATKALTEAQQPIVQAWSSIQSIVSSAGGSTPAAQQLTIDTNDDGKPDAADLNGDGKPDAFDTTGDGKVDHVDTTGDGKADSVDLNADGKADIVDSDGDGIADTANADDLMKGLDTSKLSSPMKTLLSGDETQLRSSIDQLSNARTVLASAKSTLKSAQDGLKNYQDAYDRAVAQRKKLTVTAPISGTITDANSDVAVGDTVSTTSALCTIEDTSQLVIQVPATDSQVSKAQVGQEVRISFPDVPDLQVTSTVAEVGTSTITTSSGGHAFPLRVVIGDPDPALKVGMQADAQVILQSIPDSLIVPLEALDADSTGTYLNVLLDPTRGIETRIPVTVVATNATQAAISAPNIQADTTVILGGGSSDPSSGSDAGSSAATQGDAAGSSAPEATTAG